MGNLIIGLIALAVLAVVLCGIVALGIGLIGTLGPVFGTIVLLLILSAKLN
jgi:hypothetical protein